MACVQLLLLLLLSLLLFRWQFGLGILATFLVFLVVLEKFGQSKIEKKRIEFVQVERKIFLKTDTLSASTKDILKKKKKKKKKEKEGREKNSKKEGRKKNKKMFKMSILSRESFFKS